MTQRVPSRARWMRSTGANLTEQLTQPWEMYAALRNQITGAVGAYANAHPGRVAAPEQFRSDSERAIGLRDSIIYRFESLAFHFDLLHNREQSCLDAFCNDL